jgi:hypothetical protein
MQHFHVVLIAMASTLVALLLAPFVSGFTGSKGLI